MADNNRSFFGFQFKRKAIESNKKPVSFAADNEDGWDFRNGDMTNLFDAGIIDPVKVTRTALQNAASCAGTLITTNFGIIQTE